MGLIFVFDMDATIAGDYVFPSVFGRKTSDIDLNPKILELLKIMKAGLKDKKVDAIFLYTNNSDLDYITLVKLAISERLGGFEFNDTMSCRDPRRIDNRHRLNIFNPKKLLGDVRIMSKENSVSVENLENRVFFFDDFANHKIRDELPDSHYIHINPPYSKNKLEDWTDYSSVYFALAKAGLPGQNAVKGGKRITRRKQKSSKVLKAKKWSTRRLRKPGPK